MTSHHKGDKRERNNRARAAQADFQPHSRKPRKVKKHMSELDRKISRAVRNRAK